MGDKNYLGTLQVPSWIFRNDLGKITLRHKNGTVGHYSDSQLQRQIQIANDLINSGDYTEEQCEQLRQQIRMWEHGLTL